MVRRAIGTALLATLLVLILTAVHPTPGKGRKAERVYRAAAPVVRALAKYREATGEYPVTLDALVPKYLDELPEGIATVPISYIRTATTYKGRFVRAHPSYKLHSGYSVYSVCGRKFDHCFYTPERGWYAFRNL